MDCISVIVPWLDKEVHSRDMQKDIHRMSIKRLCPVYGQLTGYPEERGSLLINTYRISSKYSTSSYYGTLSF